MLRHSGMGCRLAVWVEYLRNEIVPFLAIHVRAGGQFLLPTTKGYKNPPDYPQVVLTNLSKHLSELDPPVYPGFASLSRVD